MRISGIIVGLLLIAGCAEAQAQALLSIKKTLQTADSNPVNQAPAGSFIGRWYSENVSACINAPGDGDEGLIEYTSKEFIGYESSCRIAKVNPKGTKVDLTLQCEGEGETYTNKETVEVIDGMLKRTSRLNGKAMTFTYRRCP